LIKQFRISCHAFLATRCAITTKNDIKRRGMHSSRRTVLEHVGNGWRVMRVGVLPGIETTAKSEAAVATRNREGPRRHHTLNPGGKPRARIGCCRPFWVKRCLMGLRQVKGSQVGKCTRSASIAFDKFVYSSSGPDPSRCCRQPLHCNTSTVPPQFSITRGLQSTCAHGRTSRVLALLPIAARAQPRRRVQGCPPCKGGRRRHLASAHQRPTVTQVSLQVINRPTGVPDDQTPPLPKVVFYQGTMTTVMKCCIPSQVRTVAMVTGSGRQTQQH